MFHPYTRRPRSRVPPSRVGAIRRRSSELTAAAVVTGIQYHLKVHNTTDSRSCLCTVCPCNVVGCGMHRSQGWASSPILPRKHLNARLPHHRSPIVSAQTRRQLAPLIAAGSASSPASIEPLRVLADLAERTWERGAIPINNGHRQDVGHGWDGTNDRMGTGHQQDGAMVRPSMRHGGRNGGNADPNTTHAGIRCMRCQPFLDTTQRFHPAALREWGRFDANRRIECATAMRVHCISFVGCC